MRALIIDKDPAARELLAKLLSKQATIKWVDECTDCLAAASVVGRNNVDIAFLTIGLEELNGAEQVLRQPRSRLPRFVFLSDNPADVVAQLHTPTGLELEVLARSTIEQNLNSVLQFSRTEDIDEAGSEIQEQLRFVAEHCGGSEEGQRSGSRAIMPHLQRVLVKNGNDSRLIAAEAIDWVESADHYVYLHSDGRSHLLYATMNSLQKRLPPGKFIRAHRGAIINVESVRRVTNGKFGTLLLTLADDSQVRVSRSRREAVRKSLK
jgi:two-component system LytT family response regulator